MNDVFISIKPSEQKWVFNELEELSINASRPNWDNLGSAPLDSDTYQIAKRFILALPSSLPAPELTVDRDGEVNFDWFGSGGQIFSIKPSEQKWVFNELEELSINASRPNWDNLGRDA